MPLKSYESFATSTRPQTRLPRMSNQQFDEVEREAREQGVNLWSCPTCGNKPDHPMPVGEPVPDVVGWASSTYRYLGKDYPCDCAGQIELARHYLLAHIPERYWRLGKPEYFGDKQGWRETEGYLAGWPDFKRFGLGLEFHSATQGSGKTLLVSWIARQLIQAGEAVYYTRFREVIGLYNMPYDEQHALAKRLSHTTVLVLDEVGGAISDAQRKFWALEFEDLMRSRVDGNRVTLMTTNLMPEQMDEDYRRTYSLLCATQHRYEMKGVDVRRSNEVHRKDLELIENKETRPIC